jgi:hypothetical protein
MLKPRTNKSNYINFRYQKGLIDNSKNLNMIGHFVSELKFTRITTGFFNKGQLESEVPLKLVGLSLKRM